RRLAIPPADAYGVVSFYARFALQPRGELALHVCDDIACKCAGADELCATLEKDFGAPGSVWHRSPCLGLCDRAPAALVERAGVDHDARQVAPITPAEAGSILRGGGWPATPVTPTLSSQGRGRLLRRIGVVDPDSIDSYINQGGFAALRRARELGPEAVIREVTDARLLGRGGAAFPTGRKWESVARAEARPHYIVCNADESEPGTFKDRELMENDPFAVIEGMAVAAFATGCEKGFLYVRTEYPLARKRIEGAIAQTRARGMLEIDIEVRRGAGAYICGEETALFNSIEGKRGEPRNKPPFPVEVGLFGKPTVENNVETLVVVFDITADMKGILLRIARFFRDESCGQCVPCRVGTKRQEEILERLLVATNGDGAADVMLLSDIARAMRDASICGLGQTAANAIGSGLTQLRVLNG